MDAYLVLQVIEERAIEQFAMMEPVLRRYDSKSADDIRGIAKDEERHLLYCRAISARYAPSEARRSERLTEFREAEAAAFREQQGKGLGFILDQKLLSGPTACMWRATVQLLGGSRGLPYTRFHQGNPRNDMALAA